MKNEEKELLFKDLCGRLPYHVRVKVWLADGDTEEGPLDLQHNYGDVLLDAFYYEKITKIRPYLRPMSSMTEEEKDYYDSITYTEDETHFKGVWCKTVVDWLNSHHFDYRGLIPMGLAIEAPKDMYKN